MKYTKLEQPLAIRGYGNGTILLIGEIKSITVKVDEAQVIVLQGYQEILLIIGQPFCEQEHITVIKRGQALRIIENTVAESDDDFKQFKVPDLSQLKVNSWAKETLAIPNDFVGFIDVYTHNQESQKLYIEKNTEYKTSIPRCVIELAEKSEGCLPVANVTGRNLILNKGDKITKGTHCVAYKEDDVHLNDAFATSSSKIDLEQIDVNKTIQLDLKLKLYGILIEF